MAGAGDESLRQWRADYDAAVRRGDEETNRPARSRADAEWSSPPALTPQSSLPLTGGTLVPVPGDARAAPAPLPAVRDLNWWRDLGRRTAVAGRERIVLDALLDRIWTGPDDPREGRVNGQWRGYQSEIQADCGGALSLRTTKRAVKELIEKGTITRRFVGQKAGGRGKSVYRILPSNPLESRSTEGG